MLRESHGGDVAVPPTIQALLAARLDQLDPPDRDVLQSGSVEGRVFHRGAVQVLAPDESQVTTRLTALVRKELVRPDSRCCLARMPSVPAPADQGRRLQRFAEGDAGRAPRALRRLARRARLDAGRAGRDPRLPPGAGVPVPQRARERSTMTT